ncbi:hypothetical protein BTO03_25710, partial [Vibrio parahaemolyticus]
MKYIAVSDYVLVTQETIPAQLVVFVFFAYWIFCGLIAEKSKAGAGLLFFLFFLCISLFYSNNGPDKGSYATFFIELDGFFDVFRVLNTVDSPVYYMAMMAVKKIGMSYDEFFIIQNILIASALAYLVSKRQQGIHLAFYLVFSHLLIPFSVRAHLLVLMFFFVKEKKMKTLLTPMFLFLHPLMSIFPLLALNSDSIIKHKKLFLSILIPLVAVASGFVYAKLYTYIVNSDVYVNKTSFPLGLLFSISQVLVFYPVLRANVNFNLGLAFSRRMEHTFRHFGYNSIVRPIEVLDAPDLPHHYRISS